MADFYIKKHENFIESLKLMDQIKIMKNEYILHDSTHKSDSTLKQVFPKGIIQFYHQFKSLHISWKYNFESRKINFLDEQMDFIEGEFNLLDKERFLEGINGKALENDFDMLVNSMLRRELFPFEELPNEYLVCINRKTPDQIVFIDLDESKYFEIRIDFESYMNCGYKCYFFYGWQKAIFLSSASHLNRLKHYLGQLIPGFNLNLDLP
ncbi:MAG: hypothetical protein KFF73_07720 [Cyclobacteriaceae bacterium]|nr:hypothetical protein [Cyclobacteriaceae bacterium]